MKQINLPIYIDVENNKVFAVWYEDENGDVLLNEGSDYTVSYSYPPKRKIPHHKKGDKSIDWLKPKTYKDWEKEENEE